MNFHFLSFIADVICWLAAGYFVAKLGITIARIKKAKQKQFIFKAMVATLIGGLHATFLYALPAFGLALYHFAFAIGYALTYVLISLLLLQKNQLKKVIRYI